MQIGYFVYQYAKLRMVNFFYDVIDRFISRADYCLTEMDTGSSLFYIWCIAFSIHRFSYYKTCGV